uniref:Integrin alpha-2 domain-containing protein n=1 Tax=Eptatretus burgeri TaxID=7764 RepID=A0A8C4WWY9_EPTBU
MLSTNLLFFTACRFLMLWNLNILCLCVCMCTTGQSGNRTLENEFAQAGFSAAVVQEEVVLGAVGANEWRGGIVRFGTEPAPIPHFVKLDTPTDSYLGYSLSSLCGWSTSFGALLVAGSPREGHVGGIHILALHRNGSVATILHQQGSQLGSYFGAEILSLEMIENKASRSNEKGSCRILVGTPGAWRGDREQGSVIVYAPQKDGDKISLQSLPSLVPSRDSEQGWFGAVIENLGDLDGDGERDVAVGAPRESEGTGAIYIYLSHNGELSSKPSQRIKGTKTSGLFGLALALTADLTGDGLPDLAVGSFGLITILRSLRVVRLQTILGLEPNRIPLPGTAANGERNGHFNFSIFMSLTAQATGEVTVPLKIELNLDVGRRKPRAEFVQSGKDAGVGLNKLVKNVTLKLSSKDDNNAEYTCKLEYFITVADNVEDRVRPIHNSFDISIIENEPQDLYPSPVLDPSSPTSHMVLLHFSKDCGKDDICLPDLSLHASLSSHPVPSWAKHQTRFPFLTGYSKQIIVNIRLKNNGEDSYNTFLFVYFPSSFYYNTLTNLSPHDRVACDMVQQNETRESKLLRCQIAQHMFKAQALLNFKVLLSTEERQTMQELFITASVKGENETKAALRDNSAEPRPLPILTAANLFLTEGEEMNAFVDILVKGINKETNFTYKVLNQGQEAVSFYLDFLLPVTFDGVPALQFQKASKRVECSAQREPSREDLKFGGEEICGTQHCILIPCKSIELLPVSENMDVSLTFTVLTKAFTKNNNGKFTLVTSGRLHLNNSHFVSINDESQHRAQVNIVVSVQLMHNFLLIIGLSAGGGLLLLLLVVAACYKAGFFKRNQMQEPNVNGGNTAQDVGRYEVIVSENAKEPAVGEKSDAAE